MKVIEMLADEMVIKGVPEFISSDTARVRLADHS